MKKRKEIFGVAVFFSLGTLLKQKAKVSMLCFLRLMDYDDLSGSL